MALEQYLEEALSQNDSFGEDNSSLEKWKTLSDAFAYAENNTSDGFDCNICLEAVQDPVVTLCGHLYCWPCIYKWLHFQTECCEDQQQQQQQQQQQCPVCKAEISQTSLVPLYGKGQTTKSCSKGKDPSLGIVIPQRPLGPAQQFYQENYSYQAQEYQPNSGGHYNSFSTLSPADTTTTNMFDSRIGVFGEMVYARVFKNTITNVYTYPNSYHLSGSSSPRVRRHIMQAANSLNRVCFFLFCFSILCLLSF